MKIEQLLSEIIELQSVKHGTSLNTSRNFILQEEEKGFEPSETQPNDTLSIREVLERFTKGQPLDTGDIGYYDDPDAIDLSDYDDLDPFEKEMFIRENRETLDRLERELNEQQELEQENADQPNPINSSAPQAQESARSETGHQEA